MNETKPPSLVQSTDPIGIDLAQKSAFLGMNYGQRVPIDVATVFLAGREAGKYHLLLVDEFQRFNSVPEEEVAFYLGQTQEALKRLGDVYGFFPEIIVSSDFMRTPEYKSVVMEMHSRVLDCGMEGFLLETVPKRRKFMDDAINYPLNEIACTAFLNRTRGIEVKVGPSQETAYDFIMRKIGLPLYFAYLTDAYALDTREPQKVVHYIPGDRGNGENGEIGQRIFLEDYDFNHRKALTKLSMANDQALRYFLRVASVAGYMRGVECLAEEQINSMNGNKLKKTAQRLVVQNILEPYQRALI
ncbi:MAG: hypothetical protein HYW26_06055 [Candidatus Aenigmarchaeota archaeon]|nr:hypothetical protein [Candidatus Aenigmarchaeota archaeon]